MNTQEQEVISSTSYDMMKEPNEVYYSKQYWYWISWALGEGVIPYAKCLDLGCGQGRLSIPLAKRFQLGQVLAVDFSQQAIDKAKIYSEEEGVENILFFKDTIKNFIGKVKPLSLDVILMTEVTFYYPDWEEVIDTIKSLLKPEGFLFISFRSQYYDALNIVDRRAWNSINMLFKKRRGFLYKEPVELSWQISGELQEFFSKQPSLNLINIVGIGCCSGISFDPHSKIVQPKDLDDNERAALMNLELSLAKSVPDTGRYMLCILQKLKNSV